MKIKRIFTLLLIILFVCSVLVSCDSSGFSTELAFKESEITLNIGDVKNLALLIETKNLQFSQIRFSSSNDNVAIIRDGILSAKSAGDTIITATSSVKSATCHVIVTTQQSEIHVCYHMCSTCGKCLDGECKDTVCQEKCAGHTVPGPKRMSEEEWKQIFNRFIKNEFNFSVDFAAPLEDSSASVMYSVDKRYMCEYQGGKVVTNSYEYKNDGIVYEYTKSEYGTWVKEKTTHHEIAPLGDFGIIKILLNEYEEYDFTNGVYSRIEESDEKKTLEFGENELFIKIYSNENGTFVEYNSYHFYNFGNTQIDLPAAEEKPNYLQITEEEWREKFAFWETSEKNYTVDCESKTDSAFLTAQYADDKSYNKVEQDGDESEQYWQLVNGIVYEYNKNDNGQWDKKETGSTQLVQLGDYGLLKGNVNNYNEFTYINGGYTNVTQYGETITFMFTTDGVYVKFYEEKEGVVMQDLFYHFYDFGTTQIEIPSV